MSDSEAITLAETFRLFASLSRPYFFMEDRKARRALWWQICVVALLIVVRTSCFIALSFAEREFQSGLTERNPAAFWRGFGGFCCCIVVGAPVMAVTEAKTEQFTLHWRHWMMQRLFSRYFRSNAFYHLPLAGIDNPDQRLTADVEEFIGTSTMLLVRPPRFDPPVFRPGIGEPVEASDAATGG